MSLSAVVRADLRRRVNPSLPRRRPPGLLAARPLGTLSAAIDALLPPRFAEERYVAFLQWRASCHSGYLGLYERFAAQLERDARRRFGASFTALRRDQRCRLLPISSRIHGGSRIHRKVRRLVIARSRWLFHQHIVVEVLDLYARTDAWTAAGYPEVPGYPRAFAHAYEPLPLEEPRA